MPISRDEEFDFRRRQCPVCPRKFVFPKDRANHMRAKHRDWIAENPNRPLTPVRRPARVTKLGRPRQVANRPFRATTPAHPNHNKSQPARAAESFGFEREFTTYRGNAYSSAVKQNRIWTRISNLCHTEERLHKEGYTLPNTEADGTQSSYGSASRIAPPCPGRDPAKPKYAALVIDCEMGGTKDGEDQLIKITILEFFTGNSLLSSRLVKPARPVSDWREHVTGLNATIMSDAVSRSNALDGWEAARAELWRFADEDTILIGQSLWNDLRVLHTSHARVIDTAIITADAVLGADSDCKRRWGLKALCHDLLSIQIRRPDLGPGGAVHDDLEDCLATREVVLVCAMCPEFLESWAQRERTMVSSIPKNKKKGSKPVVGKAPTWRPVQSNPVRRETSGDETKVKNEKPSRWEEVVEVGPRPEPALDSDQTRVRKKRLLPRWLRGIFCMVR
ncbi:exonuclease [Colletotrichum fioriniae PJ7]|uniref:Exonuclease n=1 Tax=Colletotrichum fioriniae PJ7 TaxID=1445577 RepID=A0A010RTX7_9PEZI|nr:exonuclease [Colletotrichum fioriniae PJ7]